MCANPDGLQCTQICTPKYRSNKFQSSGAPIPNLEERDLFLSKHSHTLFMAKDMPEAIMISIVEYFTGNGASGQHRKVLLQAPFTDEETKLRALSCLLPPPPNLSQFSDLL